MITIVTAFYDIGRSDWNFKPRSVEHYFSNFERMCQLHNNIILFTSDKFRDRVEIILKKKNNLTVYYVDIFEANAELLEKISAVQNNESFKEGITNPTSPEYFEPRYILINYLKSYFCIEAFKRDNQLTGTVAWIDFGYCRKNRYLPTTKRWDYEFNDKIHLFNLIDIHNNIDIVDTIKTNTVYIQGCHIIAQQKGWLRLNQLMAEVLNDLLSKTLVDDDQTLLLLAYLRSKENFVIHKAQITKKLGWFFIFKHFNLAKNNAGLLSRLILLFVRRTQI